jgi:hypothetical protein
LQEFEVPEVIDDSMKEGQATELPGARRLEDVMNLVRFVRGVCQPVADAFLRDPIGQRAEVCPNLNPVNATEVFRLVGWGLDVMRLDQLQPRPARLAGGQ